MEQIKLSGLDKAAILFQVLGDGLAVTMFKDLSDTELRRVRVRAKELTQVSFKLKKAILEEFYFGFMNLISGFFCLMLGVVIIVAMLVDPKFLSM